MAEEKKRLLFVTQELSPYNEVSELSKILSNIPQFVYDQEIDVRILMPRFGSINERRHKLHEVVRLSGINIIVDDEDYPLTIKVASLPKTRLQVYFIDNDDYFQRKHIFTDENGETFDDNAERMIFFCKGVLETIKKFMWAPHVIHCHGWMTSLIPYYIKTAYKKEQILNSATTIFSPYENTFEGDLLDNFTELAAFEDQENEGIDDFKKADIVTLYKQGIDYADAVLTGAEGMDSKVAAHLKKASKQKEVIPFAADEEERKQVYLNYYRQLLGIEEIESVED